MKDMSPPQKQISWCWWCDLEGSFACMAFIYLHDSPFFCLKHIHKPKNYGAKFLFWLRTRPSSSITVATKKKGFFMQVQEDQVGLFLGSFAKNSAAFSFFFLLTIYYSKGEMATLQMEKWQTLHQFKWEMVFTLMMIWPKVNFLNVSALKKICIIKKDSY